MPSRRKAILVFLFFGLIYVLTNSFRSTFQMPDEEYVLIVTGNLVSGKPLHLPDHVPNFPGVTDIGKNGKRYSAYQIGQALVYAPFYFVTRHLMKLSRPYASREFGGSRTAYETWLERETRRYLYVCTSIFSALSCAIFFLFALRLGYSEATSLILTLLFGLGTMIWPYSKYLVTEASQTTLLLTSVYLLYAQKEEGRLRPRAMALAGAAFGLLLSIRLVFSILLPLLALYWFYRNAKERRLLAPILLFGVPLLALVFPQIIYNSYRFGNIASSGYGGAGFTTPFYVGLFGYLFSPGKSYFLYTPAAVLFFFGIRHFLARARSETFLFVFISILVPLQYASWSVWSGDPAWGPRFLLVITPFLLLPAGEVIERVIEDRVLWRRACVAFVCAMSFGVQLLGVSVHYLDYFGYVQRNATLIPPSRLSVSPATNTGHLAIRDRYLETEFIPEYSPILGHWWMVKSLLRGRRDVADSAPWAGLGLNRYHAGISLKTQWDYWLYDLFEDGIRWANIKLILGVVTMVIVLSIVGQELYRSVFFRRPN